MPLDCELLTVLPNSEADDEARTNTPATPLFKMVLSTRLA